jgi:putative transposase
MKRAPPRDPELARRWLTFLCNHREITAMDFFTVPRSRSSCCTANPISSWIVQQLREAFPYQPAPKFLLFDHDRKYGLEVPAAIGSLQITCVRTSIRSPWQNGVAERWVETCRRDLLDHIIAANERHLKRLLADYIRYYHDDRTHLGLRKQTPAAQAAFSGTGLHCFSSASRWPAPSL